VMSEGHRWMPNCRRCGSCGTRRESPSVIVEIRGGPLAGVSQRIAPMTAWGARSPGGERWVKVRGYVTTVLTRWRLAQQHGYQRPTWTQEP
jgi:hypothetical protein